MAKTGPKPQSFEARFTMEPNSGCWLWLGKCTSFGYGVLLRRGKEKRAHRESWEIFKGTIPEGKSVLHRCDTPPCVNPDHLFLGTQADNLLDMRKKGRAILTQGGGPIGEESGASRLKREDVFEIRKQIGFGLSHRLIAMSFGIARQTVSAIHKGETWRWLSDATANMPVRIGP